MTNEYLPESKSNSAGQSDTPIAKTAAYYKSLGYQVFEQYGIALKVPIKLENIRHLSKEKNDFMYGGFQNEDSDANLAFYQVTINKLPSAYGNLSIKEKKAFDEKMMQEAFPKNGKRTTFKGYQATTFNYRHNAYNAKSIMIIKDGHVYGFNLITNNKLEDNFNKMISNIQFIEK